MNVPPPNDPIGTILQERYQVEQRIGQGGMGVVYKALDLQNQQSVALKALRPEKNAANPDLLKRFIREGQILRELDHPNIVRLLDTFEQDGVHYLVMDYVPGGNLNSLIEAGDLPDIPTVLSIAIDIADALTRAHRLHILHRDIKPANVLLEADGTVRLTDFGIASLNTQARLTETGSLIGTIAYLPPEACIGLELDERADIWSFGVLLYELLQGETPFSAEQPIAVMNGILRQELPDVQSLRPEIPDALADLLYRMLVKDRDGRIPSVRLVGAELEQLLKGRQPAVNIRDDRSLMESLSEGTSIFDTPTPDLEQENVRLPAQSTRFVGRKRELAEIERLLSDPEVRMLTLLGAGGMGKTRLAIEAARAPTKQFKEGVVFVDLAPVEDPDQVPRAMADALELVLSSSSPPPDQVRAFLRRKHMLLLLDNFEHLLDGAPFLSELLAHASGLKLLATSRSRLDLVEEHIFQVQGLDTPVDDRVVVFEEVEAIDLFLACARRTLPDYALQENEKAHVVRICRLVEGMPLGIQLAANWVRTIPPEEIADELASDLDFLSSSLQNLPARQRSMRAVFDYSWKLLPDDHQLMFQRLSVFRGGFTRMAARDVAGANVRSLSRLVDCSLLSRTETGRFRAHELMRQIAREELDEKGEMEAIRDAHSAYYLRRLAEKKGDLHGGDQLGALEDIARDIDNVQAAWLRAVEKENEALLLPALESVRLFTEIKTPVVQNFLFLAAIRKFESKESTFGLLVLCLFNGPEISPQERLQTLEKAVEETEGFGDRASEAEILRYFGYYRAAAGKRDQTSLDYLNKSLSIFEELGDLYKQAMVHHTIGWVHFFSDSPEQSQTAYRKAVVLRRKIGDLNGLVTSLYSIQDRNDETRMRRLNEIYQIAKRLSNLRSVAHIGVTIANYWWRMGEGERARPFLDEALDIIEEITDPFVMRWVLWCEISDALCQDDAVRARQVLTRQERISIDLPEFLGGDLWVHIYLAFLDKDKHKAKELLRPYAALVPTEDSLKWLFYSLSLVLYQEGKVEPALELMSYCITVHDWFELYPVTKRFKEQAKKSLPKAVLERAVERGRTLDPRKTFERYKAEGYFDSRRSETGKPEEG